MYVRALLPCAHPAAGTWVLASCTAAAAHRCPAQQQPVPASPVRDWQSGCSGQPALCLATVKQNVKPRGDAMHCAQQWAGWGVTTSRLGGWEASACLQMVQQARPARGCTAPLPAGMWLHFTWKSPAAAVGGCRTCAGHRDLERERDHNLVQLLRLWEGDCVGTQQLGSGSPLPGWTHYTWAAVRWVASSCRPGCRRQLRVWGVSAPAL